MTTIQIQHETLTDGTIYAPGCGVHAASFLVVTASGRVSIEHSYETGIAEEFTFAPLPEATWHEYEQMLSDSAILRGLQSVATALEQGEDFRRPLRRLNWAVRRFWIGQGVSWFNSYALHGHATPRLATQAPMRTCAPAPDAVHTGQLPALAGIPVSNRPRTALAKVRSR